MINLLSTTEKEMLYKNRLMRALVVFLGALTFAFAAGAFLLLPSVFLVLAKEKNERNQIGFLKKATPVLDEKDALVERARVISRKIGVLEKNDFFEIAPLVNDILSLKKKTARLTGFFYERTEEKSGGISRELTVKGTALSREALVSFSRALEENPAFSGVELPVSSLVQSVGIPFSLTLTLAPEISVKSK